MVLDTSAILAFAAGSISVGEVISELSDENCRFALPIVCLAEASRFVPAGHVAAMTLLVRHPHGEVTSTPGANWPVLAEWTSRLGRVDLASALSDALAHGGWVLTGEPDAYGDVTDPIIPI